MHLPAVQETPFPSPRPQQSKSVLHPLAPAGTQHFPAFCPCSPHVEEQQYEGPDSGQGWRFGWQKHTPPAQLCEQHSALPEHGRLFGLHAHRPSEQKPLWHWEFSAQGFEAGLRAHAPFAQRPLQQSESAAQNPDSGAQAHLPLPGSHEPEQHCESTVHACPLWAQTHEPESQRLLQHSESE